MPTDLAAIERAAAGLLMPSESDYPFELVRFPQLTGASLEPAELLAALQLPADSPVETTTLDHLFRNVAVPHDWHDEVQQQQVPRFQALRQAILEHLSDVQVFRVGEVQVGVYILGRTDGGEWAGLKTTLIET
jgi:hypothetical protein